jgi:hypothetical protein
MQLNSRLPQKARATALHKATIAANNAALAASIDHPLVKEELLDEELQEGARAAFVFFSTKKGQTSADKEAAKKEMNRHAKYTAKVEQDRTELSQAYKKELARVEGSFRSPAGQSQGLVDTRPVIYALLGPIGLVLGVYVGITYPLHSCPCSGGGGTPKSKSRSIGQTAIKFPIASDRDSLIGGGNELTSF